MRHFYLFLLIAFSSSINGQVRNNYFRSKKIYPNKNSIKIDSLTVIPESLVILKPNGDTISTDNYSLYDNKITFYEKQILTDTFEIQYNVFDFYLSKKYYLFDTTLVYNLIAGGKIEYNPFEIEKSVFDKDDISYKGNFMRGITIGNNQDLVLNSGLDMQISGKTSNGIDIKASISDKNIPLQPEGNTNNLRDFDKVFIEVTKSNHTLLLGDFNSKPTEGYFLKYNKKLQGLNYKYATQINDKIKLEGNIGAAIARGKFNKYNIPIIEGNLGPYKIYGANGERFIIILSGTEKVYMDGEILKRGEDNDYIIDYNQGEISFTRNLIMSKDKRVFIEFEYTDLEFQRSIITSKIKIHSDRWSIFTNIFTQQDSKTKGESNLSNTEKQYLSEIGDSFDTTLISGIKLNEEGFNTSTIMYSLIDTIVNFVLYKNILKYSTDSTEAKYISSFTKVTKGKGNYIQSNQDINGRVYIWVAPDENGNPTGDFIPKKRIAAPQLNQMVSFGGTFQINKNTKLNSEFAYSNNNPNRFSTIDNKIHKGFSLISNLNHEGKIGNNTRYKSSIKYEFTGNNFKPIQIYKSPEYERQWNLQDIEASDEHLVKIESSIQYKTNTKISYSFTYLGKGQPFRGYRHKGRIKNTWKNIKTELIIDELKTNSSLFVSEYFKPHLNLSGTVSEKLIISTFFNQEKNKISYKNQGTFSLSSFYFNEYGANLDYKISKTTNLKTTYKRRIDLKPKNKEFQKTFIADEWSIDFTNYKSKNWKIDFGLKRRSLESFDTLNKKETGNTFQGFIGNRISIAKSVVKLTSKYDLGSGQTPKIEFYYEEVLPGQGVFKWSDYNNDGIQQESEFEVADNPDEAIYIRFSQFTDEFIPTINLNFNNQMVAKLSKLKFEKSLFDFIKKIEIRSLIKSNNKTKKKSISNPYVPKLIVSQDTSIISTNITFNNSIFFNKGNPNYNFELGQKQTNYIIPRSIGSTSTSKTEKYLIAKKEIGKSFTINAKIASFLKTNSETTVSRNYILNGKIIRPEIEWLKKAELRTKIAYEYQSLKNTIGDSYLESNEFIFSFTYAKSINASINTSFSYIFIDYFGQQNTPVSYAMIGSKKSGKNMDWSINLNSKISKNLILTIIYNGRKYGTQKPVHTGNMQLRAAF